MTTSPTTTTAFAERTHPSPVGDLTLIAGPAGLRAVLFPVEKADRVAVGSPTPGSGDADRILDDTERQLDEYFAGDRTDFDLPLDPVGTQFQLRAWDALREIPYGETRSYGQQASRIGSPAAVRAVGSANGRNPISIIVPCHRVVGADGSLTGYGGGIETKRFLLALESSGQPSLFD